MTDPLICEFRVEAFVKGRRIETFLGRHLRTYTSWRIQRMIQAGCVTVNDAPAELSHRVRPNEVVRIRLASPPDRVTLAEVRPLTILYEDPWLIAVSKPPGQMPHPGGIFQTGTLINALQPYLDRQSVRRGLIRPGIVHRLDRQTSGVMVIPKDHASHRGLTAQFADRTVSKKYRAILHGVLRQDSGEIDLPIGKVPNPTCALMSGKPFAVGAKTARTTYRVLERFDRYTFVEAQPQTGRHHQIRIHFAEIGHPLLADEFYGPFGVLKDGTPVVLPESGQPEPEEAWDEFSMEELMRDPPDDWTKSFLLPHLDPDLPIQRQALHAAELAIDHPISGMPIAFEAPLPDDMEATLAALRERSLVQSPR
ncbi:MAG: RluA family pseudouridine synthase [Planctomycetota bacterium]|nr:RluA family pseudouridine synthase [Planctomycetota bacterium]MDA1249678.1 RluA family pseudouridine synthase [Planctomycetota bacterium]